MESFCAFSYMVQRRTQSPSRSFESCFAQSFALFCKGSELAVVPLERIEKRPDMSAFVTESQLLLKFVDVSK